MGDASLGRLVAGRYELVGVLGEGTFGVVYDAVHRVIGRRVAVKLLREEIGRDPELVQRFQLEARAAGALGHPNIVQIFDAGQMEGGDAHHFLVMERVEGTSLATEVARGPLEIARAIDIAAQVLSGLAAAHRRSIVHRDLKPENILLGIDEEGREVAKIADFGISKVLDPARLGAADVRMTGHGEILGTPLYMAPEQAAGEADIDHRADLWAVGCVLYEMVCGRPPFLGENFPQILAALLRDPPLMPGTLRAEVTPALEAVIMRALSKERADRPADAAAMRSMLLAAAGAQPTAVPGRPEVTAPASAEEAAMVAALSRAVALELAEEPPAIAPPPEEPEMELAPVAPPASRPAAARTQSPPAHQDAFAPPEASAAEAVLLDVDRGLLRTSQRRTVIDTPIVPRDRAPVARRRFPLAGLVSGLLIAGILAGAAFAGYRYLTLGYVWRPGGGARLELAITPADADVTLDGEPLESNRFTIDEGQSRELFAAAPGRLALRRQLDGSREMERRLEIRLANALRPLAADVPRTATAIALPAPEGSAADLDQALGKLDLYRGCLALLAPDLAAGAAEPGELLPTMELDQCRADVERARRLTPSLGPVDAAAAGFIDTVNELDRAGRRLNADPRKRARKGVEALARAYATAGARAGDLLELIERSTGDWQERELRFLPARDGQHAELRRVALAVRRRARLAIQPGADEAAAVAAELDRALAAARAGAAAAPGAAADLVAMAAAVPAEGAARADWIAWHDKLVAAFNQLETR